jgi:hypothetical protein
MPVVTSGREVLQVQSAGLRSAVLLHEEAVPVWACPQPRRRSADVHGAIGDPSVKQVALNANTPRAHDM